ncbi:hypothetical protein RF11_06934 [Thelohanellus kitauei]|uniref:Uncharacterized protein n=1 Tax=Thelohanellus kitauei TaxID=669202 RepID=A0A0C2MMN9_THEKT|nr:hypothetical protein RF11_06934 [Thelohanellus kitauei]
MIWVALITFCISLSSALVKDCSLSSWKELKMALYFFNPSPTEASQMCTERGEVKDVDENLFSELGGILRDHFLCVYKDFTRDANEVFGRRELTTYEKKKIDDLIIEQAVDTEDDTECNVKASFNFAGAITPEVIIEELFSGEDKRHYFLPVYCYLTVAKAHLDELKAELEVPSKLQKVKTLIEKVIIVGVDEEKKPITVMATSKQIQKSLCRAFDADKELKGWTIKKYLWSNVKCRAKILTRPTKCTLKPGTTTYVAPTVVSEGDREVSGPGYCRKCDSTNFDESTSTSFPVDDDSAYFDETCHISPDPDFPVTKWQIYVIMGIPIVLGAITIPAFIAVLVKTHRAVAVTNLTPVWQSSSIRSVPALCTKINLGSIYNSKCNFWTRSEETPESSGNSTGDVLKFGHLSDKSPRLRKVFEGPTFRDIR